MHVCGVIHRDLKPENLLLTKATPDVFFTPNTTISQASIVNAHPHPTTSTSDNYHRRKSKQYAKSRLMNSLASSGHSENSEAMNSSANVIPSSMVVKVADFGLAKEVERDDKGHVVPLSTLCGTWAYSAPEMRAPDRPGYSFAIDAWALGVITYIILCGFHPFDPSGTGTQAEILAAIQSVNYNFNDPIWDTISPAAKDFIRKLLTKDPSTRMTTRQSLNHPWLLNSAPVGYNRPLGIPGGMTVGTQLSIYKTGMESKLKAGMLAVRAAIKFAAVAAASMKGDIAKKQNIEIEIIDPSCDQQNQLVEDYNLQEIVGTFVSSLKIDKVQDDDDPRAYSFSSVHQK
jgi:serine/threonine protein kinase